MKIISLNIERVSHLDRFLPYMSLAKPDVVFLQEVCLLSLSLISDTLKLPHVVFQAMTYHEFNGKNSQQGIAILSNVKFSEVDFVKLNNEKSMLVNHTGGKEIANYYLLYAKVMSKKGEEITFCTSHFPVTKDGSFSVYQQETVLNVLKELDKYKSFIFCADTNAPRGGKNFSLLSDKYFDNIPKDCRTTIDQELHRVKGIQFVVDCLFTNVLVPTTVRIQSGVSDHMAVEAEFDLQI